MSTKVPVPMVILTSPRSKQHSPNMAACWSAIYGKKDTGEIPVICCENKQDGVSSQQHRKGAKLLRCPMRFNPCLSERKTTCHFKLQPFITSSGAYLDQEIFFQLLSMCHVFSATQQLCLIPLLQHNGGDRLRQAGKHVISVDSVWVFFFFYSRCRP